MYQATITNEEINTLAVGRFPGRVLVVDSEATMREAEAVLQGATLVGYDTETRPSFQKGLKYGTALVQISTADTALLFRVKQMPLSETVLEMFSSPEVIKVGAAIRDDIRGMRKVAEFRPAGFVDLQSVVGRWGIEELSVKKMAAIVLGIKVSKAQRLTNWEAVRLTEPQQEYAAMDAWVCREMYLRLREDDPQRMDDALKTVLQQQPAENEVSSRTEKSKTSSSSRSSRRSGRNGGSRRRRRRPAASDGGAVKSENKTDHDTTDTQAG
ncbi:MAG: 3'-5' exonuclease domain-containing protein 2 [Rikenella sp.]|nr:3'-5' exonuclease domain-containing protein 2 [Rikenella sp.]